MVSDDKTANPRPTPKIEAAPEKKTEVAPENKSASDAAPAKAEGRENATATPANYSRGEGQKPVSNAYRENWNAIFVKDKK